MILYQPIFIFLKYKYLESQICPPAIPNYQELHKNHPRVGGDDPEKGLDAALQAAVAGEDGYVEENKILS